MLVTHVRSDDGDWEGFYLDGVLLTQAHSVPAWMFLQALVEFNVLDAEMKEMTAEQMEEIGNLPESLADL